MTLLPSNHSRSGWTRCGVYDDDFRYEFLLVYERRLERKIIKKDWMVGRECLWRSYGSSERTSLNHGAQPRCWLIFSFAKIAFRWLVTLQGRAKRAITVLIKISKKSVPSCDFALARFLLSYHALPRLLIRWVRQLVYRGDRQSYFDRFPVLFHCALFFHNPPQLGMLF